MQGFTGILQVDGYGSYKGLARRHPQIQLAFCLAHARRKFVAVYKATHAPLARDVIAGLGEVYAIEARIRGRSAAERRAVRQAETKPIMDGLKTRLMTVLGAVRPRLRSLTSMPTDARWRISPPRSKASKVFSK